MGAQTPVLVLPPNIRRDAIEQCIESLIALLDLVDPDPDLEPNSDLEPYLAASSGSAWHAKGPGDDYELDPGAYDTGALIGGGNEITPAALIARGLA